MRTNAKKRWGGAPGWEHGYMTYAEIAEILGVSRERVRQIEDGALMKLMHPRNMRAWQSIIDLTRELARLRDARLRGGSLPKPSGAE